jgi:hypothetical protein
MATEPIVRTRRGISENNSAPNPAHSHAECAPMLARRIQLVMKRRAIARTRLGIAITSRSSTTPNPAHPDPAPNPAECERILITSSYLVLPPRTGTGTIISHLGILTATPIGFQPTHFSGRSYWFGQRLFRRIRTVLGEAARGASDGQPHPRSRSEAAQAPAKLCFEDRGGGTAGGCR